MDVELGLEWWGSAVVVHMYAVVVVIVVLTGGTRVDVSPMASLEYHVR